MRQIAGVLPNCFETLSIAATTLRFASAWLSYFLNSARANDGDTVAQRGQRGGELDNVLVLVLVAQLAPFRVVAVLLAPSRIEPGRLDMAFGRGADPYRFVGGRDADGLDAPDDGGIKTRVGSCLGLADAMCKFGDRAHRPSDGNWPGSFDKACAVDEGMGSTSDNRHKVSSHATPQSVIT
ncbi:hypothetical protein J6500_04900 [Bradyrhizobium sp. WSM 1704]|nr:hypothetical protein [Bradyrhizobium semiaridum]MCA6121246.1 hypothetical protein [Bradyrhizobium semiaridum]